LERLMRKKNNAGKLLLGILIVFLHTGLAFGQSAEEKSNFIGIGLGYSFSGYREETVVNINRYLHTFFIDIHSGFEKGPFLCSFNAGFLRGQNKAAMAYPVYEDELKPDGPMYEYYQTEDTFTRLFLEHALDYMLWGGRTFPGYLGGALRMDIYLIETLLNPVYMNFTGLASLDVHLTQKWIINTKNELVLSLSFPVFGYAVRPHYIGFSAWPVESGITSFHNYWAGFGSIKYNLSISELITLYSNINIELSRIDFPRARKDAIFQIGMGISFTY
jgi:hypothetical protein